jgi:tRNA (guanine10-N2)-dimethyltransferase
VQLFVFFGKIQVKELLMKYLFSLGHQPIISAAEIQAVFAFFGVDCKYELKLNKFLIIETEQKLNVQEIMDRLGGTVFISEFIAEDKDVISAVSEFLCENQQEGKIIFSIKGNNAKRIALDVKKELKLRGRSVRYVEEKNTATIIHNNLVEKQSDFLILDNQIFVTRAVQDIEELSERDFGKPEHDARSGMLPPKLARMMINLAGKRGGVLLDPFCGSGAVLLEGLLMGFDVIGSDKSDRAVGDSIKNVKWISEKNNKKFHADIFKSDVCDIHNRLKPNSVDLIVTEPYLGAPLAGSETEQYLNRQAGELASLYIQAFSCFKKILKKSGTIVFVMPCFRHNEEWIKVDCIESIKKQGFKILSFENNESLLYWRKGQRLGREIWRFLHY